MHAYRINRCSAFQVMLKVAVALTAICGFNIHAAEDPASTAARPEVAGAESEAVDLAKKLTNPLANLISVPFQWNYDQGRGYNQSGTDQTLLVQPVIPLALSPDMHLIVRPIITAVWENGVNGFTGSGMGSTQLETFFAPNTHSPTIWGIGPYLSTPAGSNQFGSQQTGVGISAVLLTRQGPWTVGILGFQSWSVGGDPSSGTANNLYMQPFVAYVNSDAWTFSLNSQSNYNYDAHRTTNPVNAVISKLVFIGKMPVSFEMGARYNVSSVPGGPQGWGARAGVTFVFPK